MNLPYAASDTFSFLILIITFSLIILGFGIIIFLNILFISKIRTKNDETHLNLLKSLEHIGREMLQMKCLQEFMEQHGEMKKSFKNI